MQRRYTLSSTILQLLAWLALSLFLTSAGHADVSAMREDTAVALASINEPANAKTLILTNPSRMRVLYGQSDVDNLLDRLNSLAQDARVNGILVVPESEPAVQTAYSAWDESPTDQALANAVTEAIRSVILEQIEFHDGVEYLVLVGDDRIIPFRRVPDRTPFPESNYTAVSASTTVGSALAADMTLSDNFYADLEFTPWAGGFLHIPDLAAGRLLETPVEIVWQIDYFLNHPEPRAINSATVAGYDFVQDAAHAICNSISAEQIAADCSLIGDAWTSQELWMRLLDNPTDLISLNTHASHAMFGAPVGSGLPSSQVYASNTDLAGRLIYHLADHAGLNVPPDTPVPLDWPQVFASKRAVYIGSTGFAWGSRVGISFAEAMMVILTEQLVAGETQQVGKALAAAKQIFFDQSSMSHDAIDEKTLVEFTLYGLPMFEIQTSYFGEDDRVFLPLIVR